MTEQPDKIENVCSCGTCRRECYNGHWSWWDRSCLNSVIHAGNYCPNCGEFLDPKAGIAYRVVRADEGQLILWDDGEWAYVWDMRDLPSARELVPDGRLYRMIAVEEATDDQAGSDAEEAE